MSITLQIITEVVDCSKIKVQNITTYGTAFPDRRQDNHNVLFIVSAGNIVFYNLNDLDDWIFDNTTYLTNNTVYSVQMFSFPNWQNVFGFIYQAGLIVFHNGSFWIASVNSPCPNEPGVSPDWIQITDDSYYSQMYDLAVNQNIPSPGYPSNTFCAADIADELISCPNYIITKTSCYNYQLQDNSGNTNPKQIYVYEYDNTTTPIVNILTAPTGTGEIITFTLPSVDGVYLVSVQDTILDPNAQALEWYIIYEYCSLQACYQQMVDKLLCSEPDPCCDECNKEALTIATRFRLELNKLNALYLTLLSFIEIERMSYLGIYTIDSDRAAFIANVGMLLDKINVIVGRCGECK